MACQTKFYNFVTVYSNFRGLLIRPPLTNFTQVVTLRATSKEKLKDIPEKPKKPLTPFFLFSQTRRIELKKMHPHAKITDITKLLADEWKNVDETIKQGYEVEYKHAMTKYLQNRLDYNTKLTEDQKKILKEIAAEKAKDKKNKEVRKTLKELNKPKRPKGPFIYFVTEYHNKNKSKYANYTEFLKTTKSAWDNLSNEEKQKYNDMYLDDKKRYEIEMAEWETKMVNEGKLNLVRTNTRIAKLTPRHIIKPKASDKSMENENIKNNLSRIKKSASKSNIKPKPMPPTSE